MSFLRYWRYRRRCIIAFLLVLIIYLFNYIPYCFKSDNGLIYYEERSGLYNTVYYKNNYNAKMPINTDKAILEIVSICSIALVIGYGWEEYRVYKNIEIKKEILTFFIKNKSAEEVIRHEYSELLLYLDGDKQASLRILEEIRKKTIG